jgi:hypothetical protein
MKEITTYLSIIILNDNMSNLQWKGTGWQIVLKSKFFFAYKKCISLTNTGLKWKDGKSYLSKWKLKAVGVVIFIADKANVKQWRSDKTMKANSYW